MRTRDFAPAIKEVPPVHFLHFRTKTEGYIFSFMRKVWEKIHWQRNLNNTENSHRKKTEAN